MPVQDQFRQILRAVAFCDLSKQPCCKLCCLCEIILNIDCLFNILNTNSIAMQEPFDNSMYSTMPSFGLITKTIPFMRYLIADCGLCMSCVLRIYRIDTPQHYANQGIEAWLKSLTKDSLRIEYSHQQEKQPNAPPSQMEDKKQSEQLNSSQYCWLCDSILQKPYLQMTTKQAISLMGAEKRPNRKTFKLNIRIPTVLSLKDYVFNCHCLLVARSLFTKDQQSSGRQGTIVQEAQLFIEKSQAQNACQALQELLLRPVFDLKVILKWVLSQQVKFATGMNPTIEESPESIVIGIQQQHNLPRIESFLMGLYTTQLKQVAKAKAKPKGAAKKKVKIDLAEPEYQLNNHHLGLIQSLSVTKRLQCVKQFTLKSLRDIVSPKQQLNEHPVITNKLTLHRQNVFVRGRYVKFSRFLSQTPWIIDGKRLAQGSIQQQIEEEIFNLLYPNRSRNQCDVKFHAGGREDIDVRMLTVGRPFVVEFVDPILRLEDVDRQTFFQLLEVKGVANRALLMELYDVSVTQAQRVAAICQILMHVINHQSPNLQVNDVALANESYISNQLKQAEIEKIKHYICFICSSTPLTEENVKQLDNLVNIKLQQKTPIRVLHRRTLMVRDKLVYRVKMHLVSQYTALLEVWASAGTYIKEFVHGDLGRTIPNVGMLLGNKCVDILQLDVGGLKEGDWVEGDHEKMKLPRQPWMEP